MTKVLLENEGFAWLALGSFGFYMMKFIYMRNLGGKDFHTLNERHLDGDS